MRAKNREINIFNMSLLDILTGMLGAFLFLMLGLIPYYSRAKNAPDPNAPPPVDTILNEIVQFPAEANISIYLITPGNRWNGTDTKNSALPRGVKVDTGGCGSNTGWQNACSYSSENNHYLVAYTINTDNPQAYTSVRFLSELLRVMSDAKVAKGVTNFSPAISASELNISGARPGVMYGAVWILTDKDTSIKDRALQYTITTQVVKSGTGLPSGVLPTPPPSSTAQRIAPPAFGPGPGPVPPGFQPHDNSTPPPNNGPPHSPPHSGPAPVPNNQPDTNPPDNSPPSDQPSSDQPASSNRSWWSYINPFSWFSSGKK